MRLRVIDFGFVPAIRSQAVFHGIAENMGKDDDPVLTLVNPGDPYVCVGIHQEIAKEVNEDFCKEQNLPVYRRHVGGGTVYLDKNQMFFHFIFPRDKAPKTADKLYPMFVEPAVRTYQALGINATFRPINDIQVDGRKIGGTGAASINNATVMVGSFMFDFDYKNMSQALNVPSEKFRDKLFQTLSEYITSMNRELGKLPDREQVKNLFMENIAECLNVTPEISEATEAELAAIEEQEKELLDPDWTHQVNNKFVQMGVKISSGMHLTESVHKGAGGLIRTHLLERDDTIEDLILSGDFTCLPDSGIEALSQRLKGEKLDDKEKLASKIDSIIKELNLDIPGLSGNDFATAIIAAVNPEPYR
ncbi:MAG: biotin/lipoate A/B protein ligase family protein [Gammaproteobacteria bacterium]|nr:biotin/lipoate A/B protein ligase family protein [Gammaproteobacteria bacterium]